MAFRDDPLPLSLVVGCPARIPRCFYLEDVGGGGSGGGRSREGRSKNGRGRKKLEARHGCFLRSRSESNCSGGKDSERSVWWCESCPAGETEVFWGPAHPNRKAVEGRAEASAELGKCRAIRTGKGGFLSRHQGSHVLQESVIREGAHRSGDCVGVEGRCYNILEM